MAQNVSGASRWTLSHRRGPDYPGCERAGNRSHGRHPKGVGSEDYVMTSRTTLGPPRPKPGDELKILWHPHDARALDPM